MPRTDAENKEVYRDSATVKHYVEAEGLQPAEEILFARYLKPGCALLDIGIGGGRTSAILHGRVGSYVGIDYSLEMVEAARRRLPGLDLREMDGSDLSAFPDSSFDVVIFSFNGIDYISPAEKRHTCLRECARVLKPNGTFIYSTHNPRWLLCLPPLDGLGPIRKVRRIGYNAARSVKKVLTQPLRSVFWAGKGYFLDPVHGGLRSYAATRAHAAEELRQNGFELIEVQGGAHSPAAAEVFHPWNYFAARRLP